MTPVGRAVSFDNATADGHRLRPLAPSTKPGSFSFSGKQQRLLLRLWVFALVVLACTVLFLRTVMRSMEYELDGARARARSMSHSHANAKEVLDEEQSQLERDIQSLQQQIQHYENTHAHLARQTAESERTLQSLNTHTLDLQKNILHTANLVTDAAEEEAKYRAMAEGVEAVGQYMKHRETALWQRIQHLEQKVARESYREALEWFGPGPHRVEFKIEYPHAPNPPENENSDPTTWVRWTSYLLMEMAPIDLMPHTVNLFLKQVIQGLWDGTSVAMNARHVLQIGPQYTAPGIDIDAANDAGMKRYQDFYAKGLHKLTYQEYSPKYPHTQYTVGLAGRPSGPDFYINKIDNTIMHGPGGQMHSGEMHNEADPCFAKLMDGTRPFMDILAAIDKVPVTSERYSEYRVKIVSAMVLIQNPAGGWKPVIRGEKFDEKDRTMPLPEATL